MKLYIEPTGSGGTASQIISDADTQKDGYVESNLISDWDHHGRRHIGGGEVTDALSLRVKIKELIDEKTFALCDSNEKEIASSWFVVDLANRDTVKNQSEQNEDGVELLSLIRKYSCGLFCFTIESQNLVQLKINDAGDVSTLIL